MQALAVDGNSSVEPSAGGSGQEANPEVQRRSHHELSC